MFAFLGNIGLPELLIILVVALLLFGARLPDVARNLGKSVNEFKKGLKETEEQIKKPTDPTDNK